MKSVWHLLEQRNDMVMLGELCITYTDDEVNTLFRRYGAKIDLSNGIDLLSMVSSFTKYSDELYESITKELVSDRVVESDIDKIAEVYVNVYRGEKRDDVSEWLRGKNVIELTKIVKELFKEYTFNVNEFGITL